jgi:outer membrane beta-barrel protein
MTSMPRSTARLAALLALAAAGSAQAQATAPNMPTTPTAPPASATAPRAPEPVVVPQVERRTVRAPSYPSRDFAIGLFGGTYGTQNFGASGVGGVRLGYHITEDFFVDATFGQTKVSDEAFRQVLPGGLFAQQEQELRYYAVSAGWNLLTGEAYFGTRTAKAFQSYLVAGIGSTDFAGQRKQTYHVGMGLRLLFNDRFAVQFDARSHTFPQDLLGKKQDTINLEFTTGLTVYF